MNFRKLLHAGKEIGAKAIENSKMIADLLKVNTIRTLLRERRLFIPASLLSQAISDQLPPGEDIAFDTLKCFDNRMIAQFLVRASRAEWLCAIAFEIEEGLLSKEKQFIVLHIREQKVFGNNWLGKLVSFFIRFFIRDIVAFGIRFAQMDPPAYYTAGTRQLVIDLSQVKEIQKFVQTGILNHATLHVDHCEGGLSVCATFESPLLAALESSIAR
ncbi:MAG: hypothetical protein VR64_18505 [Desulfatitalea sp. BRH_c12]|nr:MAG: hypothetical protein VR64_18505 [Desulfatitalea sp. BRH_c12]